MNVVFFVFNSGFCWHRFATVSLDCLDSLSAMLTRSLRSRRAVAVASVHLLQLVPVGLCCRKYHLETTVFSVDAGMIQISSGCCWVTWRVMLWLNMFIFCSRTFFTRILMSAVYSWAFVLCSHVRFVCTFLNYTSQTRSCKEAVILQVGSLEEFVIAASVWMILPVGQSSWFQV